MSEIFVNEDAYEICEKYTSSMMDAILGYNYKAFFQQVLLSLFLLYGKVMTCIIRIYYLLYNNFDLVRKIDYSVRYFWKYIWSLVLMYRIEPYRLSWYSNCWIEKTSIDQYIFNEKTAEQGDYCLIDIAQQHLPFEPLFIGKIKGTEDDFAKYYCRRIDGRSTEPENVNISLFPAIPSSTYFLSITYKHPEMQDSIDLTLDHGWFMEGNEILSASFVYRQLMYQSKAFVFDDRYEIHIMDDNIRMFQIGYNEYIIINDSSYEVVNIFKPYGCVIVTDDDLEDEQYATICGNVSYQSDHSDSKDT